MPGTTTTSPTYRRRRQWSIAVGAALVILLVFVVTYVYWQREIIGTRDYEGQGNGKVVLVRVEEGDTVSGLVPQLLADNVVGSRSAMISAADRAEQTGGARDLQAGYYALREKMSADSALAALTDDNRRLGVIDIPNGTTLDDTAVVGGEARTGILTMIAANSCREGLTDGLESCVTVDQLHETIATTAPADLGVPDWAAAEVDARGADARRIEGLISPGVHLFDPTSGPVDILRELVSGSVVEYEGTGLVEMAATVGLTPYQVLTAASLVEREAPAGDFDKVARVILNRLNEDQMLQFDSTVNYDVDEQEVATTEEDRARETPWNTYAKKGLPDTPIASPGVEALQAVERPADGDWLYFVTVDQEGTTVFNRDFAAHEAAIEESRANGVLDSAR
ncbi:endolytic transglycosylase MltG [uncultured Corynebacterium sp.]|uniref:endolytic transglycosylase MltG n=1 Tax=uncultured Corynebacterium sp. TaxID=159447 RepID=UPI0025D499D4|nr:endolytic transglycosylase MltG [uncultured Corynebacterium sp.]